MPGAIQVPGRAAGVSQASHVSGIARPCKRRRSLCGRVGVGVSQTRRGSESHSEAEKIGASGRAGHGEPLGDGAEVSRGPPPPGEAWTVTPHAAPRAAPAQLHTGVAGLQHGHNVIRSSRFSRETENLVFT